MVFKAIPDHIWVHILPFLQKPIPQPLSRPPRSELRQHDLASSSLVSKLFNEICKPLLYTRIVTDDLPKLLSHIDQPSNRKLFSLTRSLHIEYSAKGEEPDYITLCREGGSWWIVLDLKQGQEGNVRRVVEECGDELLGLMTCLTVVNRTGGGILFPRMKTVAIAAIYGSDLETQHYHTVRKTNTENASILKRGMERCHHLFFNFIRSSQIGHLCLRDSIGPLSFPSIIFASAHEPQTRPVTTFHLCAEPNHFRLPLGWPARFTSDATQSDDFTLQLWCLEHHIWTLSEARKANSGTRGDKADIEIYCSTGSYRSLDFAPSFDSFGVGVRTPLPQPCDAVRQAEMVAALEDSVQQRLRLDSGLEDRVRWRTSAETPVCGACSSGPPA